MTDPYYGIPPNIINMADGGVTTDMPYTDVASVPVTVNLTTHMMTTLMPEGSGLRCDYIDTDYSIVAAILCFMCFMFGVLYTFFGTYASLAWIGFGVFGCVFSRCGRGGEGRL